MPKINVRKSRARPYTPPPSIISKQGQHITSPQRSIIIGAKVISQRIGIKIPQDILREVTNIPERDQSRIIASKEVRTRHNIPDSGPDPRGRRRVIIRSETRAVSDYLCDKDIPLEERGAPWKDITTSAGVPLRETWHFKLAGYREVNTRTIQ